MGRELRRARRTARLGILVFALLGGARLSAQEPTAATAPRRLSLAEALELAESRSEDVAVARAGVQRAEGERLRARSQYFPQIYGSAGYTRTLKSEFSAVNEGGSSDSTSTSNGCEFTPRPADPLDVRVDSLETAVKCIIDEDPLAALGSLFKNLPFGRENQVNLGLTGSQTLFAGGRVRAQSEVAESGLRTARLALASARAQMALDVAQAYHDAALADRLMSISETVLSQAQTTLEHTRLARQVGNQAEFDLLRAQVAYENQRPVVIERRTQRDLAFLRLKQILEIPADTRIELTDAGAPEAPRLPQFVAEMAPADTAVLLRAPVRQAEEMVNVRSSLVDVAEAQRYPSISLSTNYGRVAYPQTGLPTWSEFRSNWTVGVTLSMPLFLGGRIRGDEKVAEANLAEARARLKQTRELATLDTRSAREQLEAAEASFAASAGTVEQANRAYQIADIRYREGISTQVELTDARLLLQQAEANRAVAARNLQVAQIRVALLPLLPLGAGAQTAPTMDQGSAGGSMQQQQPRAQPGQQTGTGVQTIQAGSGF